MREELRAEGFFRGLLRRPVAVVMGVLALLAAGALAALRLPIELIPQGFQDTSIFIGVPWGGANPPEVEERIVRPLEEELRALTGVRDVYGIAADGSGSVVLAFPGNMDMDQAYAEVADRVERARARLPRDVDRVFLRRFTSADLPVMWIGVRYEQQDWAGAQETFTEVLQPRLEAVDGVASVRMEGLEPRAVRILLDEDRVRASQVDLGELVARLQADNVSAPVGDLDHAGARYIVRVGGRFDDLEQIESFPVREGLTIGDLGRVTLEAQEPEGFFRVNGGYGLGLAVVKETAANAFAVCREVSRLVKEEFPRDTVLGRFQYEIFWNQGDTIADSLRSLVTNALVGGAISCAVLYLFLRRVRYTLLIALSIPFSVVATLVWLYFSGGSFNLFSVMGLTIAVGMLVDNSVVVVENIFHRRRSGEDQETACARGPAEMVAPIVAATLTTVVVFLPLIFLSEDRNARVFSAAIGLPLCVAVLASLLLAIGIAPVGALRLARRERPPRAGRWSPLPWIADRIAALLDWSLRHRFRAATLTLVFLGSVMAATGGEMRPTDLQGFGDQVELSFDLSANTTLEQAEQEVLALEEVLLGDLRAELGAGNTGILFDRREGEIYLWYDEPLDEEETERVRRLLRERLPRRPAIEYHFEESFREDRRRDESWLRATIEGPESSVVHALAAEVRRRAGERPEFTETSEEEEPAREVVVTFDRERMQRAGATSMAVMGMIEWTLRGFQVSRYQTAQGDIPILIQFDEPRTPDRSRLSELPVAWLPGAVELPLATFAAFSAERSPPTIRRHNGRVSATVGFKTGSKDMRRGAQALAALMADVQFPKGYRWSQTGGWREFQEDMAELRAAFALSVALVFFLMGLLFDSLILPLAVLATIPFGVIGAFWGFRISGVPLDLLGIVGLIVLAGVVVNNGIVLVDHILNLERAGRGRRDAILQAARDRLRPILMTALTTIVGLLPVALREPTGEGFSFRSLAVGVASGLAASTLFTLWTVPLAYSLLQDAGSWLRRAWSGTTEPAPGAASR